MYESSGSSSIKSCFSYSSSTESSMGKKISYPTVSTRASNLREFSITDLMSATKNVSRSSVIGEDGFGRVFRGTVRNLEDLLIKIEVAVKKLGYKRFQIIFRDFKPSKILLNEDWNAKLSDFGLASLGPSEGLTHVSTKDGPRFFFNPGHNKKERSVDLPLFLVGPPLVSTDVVGTMGYAAPEYITTGRLTTKSDVWGYGVFLYELITGRRPVDRNKPEGEQKLLEWVRPYLSDTRKFKLILDPKLEEKYSIKSVQKLAVVANKCLAKDPKARPKMSEVLKMVTKIVEASTGNGGPQLVPFNSLKTSRDDGEGGWFRNLWTHGDWKA